MSILINGMQMPNICLDCKFEFYDKDWKMYLCDLNDKIRIKEPECFICRHHDCPLVDVPTPHGRLGDLDKLKSKFRHEKGDSDVDSAWISVIRRFITQADTIIEAESEVYDEPGNS